MCDLIARTGRLQQRYENGCRLVAGCIPFRYRISEEVGDSECEKVVEVLMITSSGGPGLLFPKGGWENDETVKEAAAREAVEEAGVRGILLVTTTLLFTTFSTSFCMPKYGCLEAGLAYAKHIEAF